MGGYLHSRPDNSAPDWLDHGCLDCPEPYHVVSGEPVREAVVNSGIKVVSAIDYQLPLPGATGGKIYTISDENGNIFTIRTQAVQ